MRSLLFSSPIGRWLLLFRALLLAGIGEIVLYAFDLMMAVDMRLDRDVYPSWLALTFVIFAAIPAAIYSVVYMAMPRLRDIGLSRWFAPIILVPVKTVAGLFFLFLLIVPASNRARTAEEKS